MMSELLDLWHGDTFDRMEPDRCGRLRPRRYFRHPDGREVPAMEGGGAQSWTELIDVLTADGTAISNSTTEAIVCPDFNIPGFYMAPGRVLRISAFGVFSNVTPTPGTLTMRVRWGTPPASGVQLLATAAVALDSAGAHTNALWQLQAILGCRTTGATGTFMSSGNFVYFTTAATVPSLMGSTGTPGASGNAVSAAADMTTAKVLSVTAQFSSATSPTNLTCQQRLIEVLN
jgi:hypothetical protein